jgi:hypothetical protein
VCIGTARYSCLMVEAEEWNWLIIYGKRSREGM